MNRVLTSHRIETARGDTTQPLLPRRLPVVHCSWIRRSRSLHTCVTVPVTCASETRKISAINANQIDTEIVRRYEATGVLNLCDIDYYAYDPFVFLLLAVLLRTLSSQYTSDLGVKEAFLRSLSSAGVRLPRRLMHVTPEALDDELAGI